MTDDTMPLLDASLKRGGGDSMKGLAEEVTHAVRATEAARERGYRDAFISHDVIVTERRVPSQITICAVTRGEAASRITLDTTRPRASDARQAPAESNRRIEGRRREIQFSGAVRGFVVNREWSVGLDFVWAVMPAVETLDRWPARRRAAAPAASPAVDESSSMAAGTRRQ